MTEHAGDLNLERLLADALRPIDPPEDLATRMETTLSSIASRLPPSFSWPTISARASRGAEGTAQLAAPVAAVRLAALPPAPWCSSGCATPAPGRAARRCWRVRESVQSGQPGAEASGGGGAGGARARYGAGQLLRPAGVRRRVREAYQQMEEVVLGVYCDAGLSSVS